MKLLVVLTALAANLAGAALGQGCSLAGGESAPEIEAMNQLLLEQKFGDFVLELQSTAQMNVQGAMKSVAEAYAAGFDGCTTLAQRRDVGGLTQQLVQFHGKAGPLFVFWLYAGTGDGFSLLQFKLDSDLEILANLR